MNKGEFKNIALAIKTSYPNAKVLQDNESMNIWYMMLEDIPYNIIQAAILEHISTNKFPPSIAEIREKCAGLTSIPVVDWGEAWESVMLAIRRCGYMQETEALESLDEITRKCVKRIGYQNICMSENITADRANFRMIYESEAERKKTDNQLPMSLRQQKQQMIEEIVSKTIVKIEKKTEERQEKPPADMDKVDSLLKKLKEQL